MDVPHSPLRLLRIRFEHEWFANSKWWFNCTPAVDAYLATTFGILLPVLDDEKKETDEEMVTINDVCQVLIFDQLPQHIHRHQTRLALPRQAEVTFASVACTASSAASASVSQALLASASTGPFRNPHLPAALAVTRSLLEEEEDTGTRHSFTPQQWTFVLLPLRHSRVPALIFEAMQIGWKKLLACVDRDSEEHRIWTRFLTATYDNAHAHDIAWTDQLQVFAPSDIPSPAEFRVNLSSTFRDILVQYNEEADDANDDGGANARQPKSDQHEGTPTEFIHHAFQKWFDDHHEVVQQQASCLVISLSGGVDSNISSFVLAERARRANSSSSASAAFRAIPLIAVHINYKNKPTCDADEAMIRAWCNYLRVPLYVRRIEEIQRKPCMDHGMRAIYESYTESVRFNAYRAAAKLAVFNEWAQRQPVVFFGHNRCDTFENIVTNLIRRQHMVNLRGMQPILSVHGVFCARPMLPVPKASIRAYARTNSIPHLQDSTPSWSQRGKIRSIIRKAMDEYDPNFVPALFDLADCMEESHSILNVLISMTVRHMQPVDPRTLGRVSARECSHCWCTDMALDELVTPFAVRFWREVIQRLIGVQCTNNALISASDLIRTFFLSDATSKNPPKPRLNVQFHEHVQVTFQKPIAPATLVHILVKLIA